MYTKSQRPKSNGDVLSSLNAVIDSMDIAKVATFRPPCQIRALRPFSDDLLHPHT